MAYLYSGCTELPRWPPLLSTTSLFSAHTPLGHPPSHPQTTYLTFIVAPFARARKERIGYAVCMWCLIHSVYFGFALREVRRYWLSVGSQVDAFWGVALCICFGRWSGYWTSFSDVSDLFEKKFLILKMPCLISGGRLDRVWEADSAVRPFVRFTVQHSTFMNIFWYQCKIRNMIIYSRSIL